MSDPNELLRELLDHIDCVGNHDRLRGSAPGLKEAVLQLHVECRAGNLPSDYCTWEGLLCILDTVYPESVFPTTRVKDEPDRDPGPRIVALIRWVAALQAHAERLAEVIHAISLGLSHGWPFENPEDRVAKKMLDDLDLPYRHPSEVTEWLLAKEADHG